MDIHEFDVSVELPPQLTLAYLRRLTDTSDHWIISIVWHADLPANVSTALVLDGDRATIQLNPAYHFSPECLARTIAHELLELASYCSWALLMEVLREIPSEDRRHELESIIRSDRDAGIDRRLSRMPFWSRHDIPHRKQHSYYA
jgi:hypothetical protein